MLNVRIEGPFSPKFLGVISFLCYIPTAVHSSAGGGGTSCIEQGLSVRTCKAFKKGILSSVLVTVISIFIIVSRIIIVVFGNMIKPEVLHTCDESMINVPVDNT